MNPKPIRLSASRLLVLLALTALPVLAQRAPGAVRPPPRTTGEPPSPPPPPAQTQPQAPVLVSADGLGRPLNGLTADEQAAFAAGRADFLARETPQTGLGPLFNDNACAACHGAPSVGGASRRTVTRFGRSVDGVFDPLTALDGTLLHAKAIAPALQETLPAEANVTARRLTTPLYGAGLIEAIPDAEILANVSAEKPAGVQGRAAMVADLATGDSRVGRFGWKAQHATLADFAADALNSEMGITNRLFPKAAAPDGNETLLARFVSPSAPIEDQPDPSTGRSEVDHLASYMRYLAPPAPAPASAASEAGRKLFASLGCAACHTPSMNTGANASAALANKDVPLYSDLLLHDMGALGDGIAQGDAAPAEMRTAPLWGLHARHSYLHDGRAATLGEAILVHDGEGAAARAAYAALGAADQRNLVAFLNSL